MKIILFILLAITVTTAHAQLVTKGFLGATNAVFNTRINAANATNATQTAAIAALISGQVSVSNLLAMGITNIIAGVNVTIATNSGTLVISSSGSGATNNIPVLQGTNLQFEIAEFDFLSIGVLIPTNTVYVATTNTATTVAEGTNFVADFNYSEQIITVTNAVNFIHGTNLWEAPTNAYLVIALINFSGANQTLAVPAAWKEALNFPTVITNGTILQLALKNYGGLSQTNILAGADQF